MKIALGLVLVGLGFAAVYLLIPWAIKIALRRRFLARARRSGAVCLTFDDGPHPEATPRILDALASAGVKGSFFVIGANIERHPEIAARIQREGHDLGEHSHRHTHAWMTDPIRTASDLIAGGKAVRPYRSPSTLRLFRPPFGKLNLVSILYLWLGGRTIACWNSDPRDYDLLSGAEIARRASDLLEVGSVLLLHDGRRTGSGAAATADAVPMILDEIHRRRLRVEPVSALFPERVDPSAGERPRA
jgi:peptidoglycan/xylan/chitin deacetylase (PgdA/CDA1 family)